MAKKKKDTEDAPLIVDRIEEPVKLSSRPWFWPVFIGVVLLVVGLVFLSAWLLNKQFGSSDNEPSEAIRRLISYVQEKVN